MVRQEWEPQKVPDPNLRNKMAEKKTNKEEEKKIEKEETVETPKEEAKKEIVEEKKESPEKEKQRTSKEHIKSKETEKAKEKEEETKEKKVEKKEIKVKKTDAVINATAAPISTKHSIAVCKFIKGKKIEEAIENLEKVISLKKAVPMKGEIPHRKGIMSGRYPKKTAEHFIKLLKGLSANANVNGLENPIIYKAIANMASRPYSKFGRVRRKRTHVKLIVKEKILKEVKK